MIAGWLSQQLGRKQYYTGAILTFTAASLACGLAPNLETLVVFRIIQGFAGGALLPTSQALIYESHVFDNESQEIAVSHGKFPALGLERQIPGLRSPSRTANLPPTAGLPIRIGAIRAVLPRHRD